MGRGKISAMNAHSASPAEKKIPINHEDGTFELAKMAVSKSARRRMVGTKLTETILQHVRDLKGTELYLETHRKLKAANALYEKMGFIKVETEVLPKKFRRDRIVMRREV